MKKIIKNFFNKLGYDLKKKDKDFTNIDLEDLLKIKINENPIIFDVGGNKGQSVTKYKKIFKKPIIHTFEPIKSQFNIINEKFKNDKSVKLNNYALGEIKGEKEFNISAQTGASSFNKINQNSKWIEVRSKEYQTTINKFVSSTKVKIFTLDDYFLNNNIDKIDLLKIDTEGYEFNVLKGLAKHNDKIKLVYFEHHYDDMIIKNYKFTDIHCLLKSYGFIKIKKSKMIFRKSFEYVYENQKI